MKRKLLSLVMAVMLIISTFCVPIVASAQSDIANGTCGQNAYWALDEYGVLTISGTGAMQTYKTYSEVPWYSYASQITSIVVEEGIETIGNWSFYLLKKATSVSLPEGLLTIGSNSFRGCSSLTDVIIPTTVTKIDYAAFSYCSNLAVITLHSNIKTIGSSAFINCPKLKDVAYTGTEEEWNQINIATGNDCLLNANIHWYEEPVEEVVLTNIEITALPSKLVYYTGEELDLTGLIVSGIYSDGCISPIDGFTVSGFETETVGTKTVVITYEGFITEFQITVKGQYLAEGTIAKTIKWTLDFDGLLRISGTGKIPDYETYNNPSTHTQAPWGKYDFDTTSLIIEDGITSVGKNAFFGLNIKNATLTDDITYIGEDAFQWCSYLTEIKLPKNLKELGYGAFSGCSNLGTIEFNRGLETIGASAFDSNYKLEEINIPSTVTTIGGFAFSYNPALTKVTLPDSITSFGDGVFKACTSLESIEIPSNFTSVPNQTFWQCTGLKTVTIPASVTSVGDYAFRECTSLTDVYYGGYEEQWGNIAFGYENESVINADIHFADEENNYVAEGICGENLTWTLDKEGTLTISGEGEMDNYGWSENYPWYSYRESIINVKINNGLTSIKSETFYRYNHIKSVSIPDSVTSIGDYAFLACESLTSITIPENVTDIGIRAFLDCYSLEHIEVDPNNSFYISLDGNLYNKNATELIQYAIGKKEESFTIPRSVTTIGREAFYACNSLKSITMPSGLSTIGACAFESCHNLSDVIIPDSVTSINGCAFEYCYNLTSIAIPDGITKIADNTFFGSRLQTISLPESITSIGMNAFGGTSLQSITLPKGVKSIGMYAFNACSELSDITIPDTVETIKSSAFIDCTNLTDVYYTGTKAQWDQMSIGTENDSLLNANIHFAEADPVYSYKYNASFKTSTDSKFSSDEEAMADVIVTRTEYIDGIETTVTDITSSCIMTISNSIITIYYNDNLVGSLAFSYNPVTYQYICGTVYSKDLEAPLSDAVVYLFKDKIIQDVTLTNEKGEYSFNADDGTYTLMVSPAYVDTYDMTMYQLTPASKEITVSGETTEHIFNITMPLYGDINSDGKVNIDDVVEVKASYTSIDFESANKENVVVTYDTNSNKIGIKGTIYSPEFEIGIESALVYLYQDDILIATALTDNDGSFSFDVSSGTYTVMVSSAITDTYDMSVYQLSPVKSQVEVTDCQADVYVNVYLPLYGDVNGDNKVNIDDVVEVKASYTMDNTDTPAVPDEPDTYYTVIFDPNNGEQPYSANVIYGSKVPVPLEPSKSGYKFAGWAKGAEPFDFNTEVVTGNIYLTAHWILYPFN